LLIDDDATMHELVEHFLGHDGLRLVTSSSGRAGLEMARHLQPLVIILDVLMPGMDGWAVLSQLKADAQTSHIPVIMLTMLEDRSMGYALGAAEFLTKPLDRDRLHKTLDKYRAQAPSPDDNAAPVLVVEDDPTARTLLRRMLESEGWTVAEAANGREALEYLAQHQASLILLDLMMPEIDGFTFLAALRADSQLRNVPVVVVSAKEISGQEAAQLAGRVQHILRKGAYDREQLLTQVRQLVQNYARRPESKE
jgi:CheY-like chemotaxis protein